MTSPSRAGQRRAHSTASAFDLAWISQYPPTASLASAKGPSTMLGFRPENVRRVAVEGGCSPSRESSTPAFDSASVYFAIWAIISALGRSNGSACSYPFGIISSMKRTGASAGRLPPGGLGELFGLCAQAFLLLPQLGSQRGAEVVGLKDLADLDLGLLTGGVGAALHPLDRCRLRLQLPDPEAGDQLLRFGERTVDHGPLRAREPNARAFRARLEPLAREHHAGLDELFVELAHLRQHLLVR